MHRSRFCAFVIDCKTDDIDAAAAFWSRAFGKPVVSPSDVGWAPSAWPSSSAGG